MKLHLEQLLENKSPITESQTSLHQELRYANQEAGVAVEAAADFSDLEESMEMDTPDKELVKVK
jgi:hypothetical protein